MSQSPSFTELNIAITAGDVRAFEDAVEKVKIALTDLAKSNAPGVALPLEPSEPVSPDLSTFVSIPKLEP